MFRLSLSASLLLLLMQTCSKNQLAQNSQSLSSVLLKDTLPCYDPTLDTTTVPDGWVHIIPTSLRQDALTNVNYPECNPSNPYEFVYLKKEVRNNNKSIVKFDLSNGKSEILYYLSSEIPGLRWNKSGEIVFVDNKGVQIYSLSDHKLKPITTRTNVEPVWCKNDSEVLLREGDRSLIRYSKTGTRIDSIPLHGLWGHFSLDCNRVNDILIFNVIPRHQFAIVHADNSISYYPYNTLNPNDSLSADNPPIEHARFNPANDNEVFFKNAYGLYKYELSTQTVTLIKANCGSKIFQHFTISSNGQKIITDVNIRLKLPNGKVGDHNILYIMDIDGSNEKIINLPE